MSNPHVPDWPRPEILNTNTHEINSSKAPMPYIKCEWDGDCFWLTACNYRGDVITPLGTIEDNTANFGGARQALEKAGFCTDWAIWNSCGAFYKTRKNDQPF
jgi:hypothetical protein